MARVRARGKLILLSFSSGASGRVRRNPDETHSKVRDPITPYKTMRYDVSEGNGNVLGQRFRAKNVTLVPSSFLQKRCQMVQVRRLLDQLVRTKHQTKAG